MPKQFITLQDIHSLNGTVGPLIEENIEVAPVVARTPVKRMDGLEYTQPVRKTRPSGGFTNVGEGIQVTAGSYDNIKFNCKHMEAQLEVIESVIKAHQANGTPVEDILTGEASALMKDQLVDLDLQFFKGALSGVTGANKGFPGLQQMVDDSMTFGAGGTSSTLTSAYIVFEDIDHGVSFLMPNGHEISLSPWQFGQLVVLGSRTNGTLQKTNGYSSGLTGYLGLKAVKPERCIARVCNMDKNNPLDDTIGELVRSMFKAGYKPTVCYMNPMSVFWLQKGRSATVVHNNPGAKTESGGRDLISPRPTDVGGIPIVETDSLTQDESEVADANARTSDLL
ncbi:major capsid protein [Rubellicoccus peritrichatus]|uniref:Uncharacterized protein n=1 Tax=Rubellicoccus peritrichatus TaxID=3080537 RepID=A0AAQ3QXS9_9BACT|nr:hypothetical protein [Puniceicoccus sp. CR14]WOO43155.1 hypothetical protein RZN69_08620 [Puniceicoccus sp. CR14]